MSDSYTVSPKDIPNGYQGNVVISYASSTMSVGTTYSLKKSNTTLNSKTYTIPDVVLQGPSFSSVDIYNSAFFLVAYNGNLYYSTCDQNLNRYIMVYDFSNNLVRTITANNNYASATVDYSNNKIYLQMFVLNVATNVITKWSYGGNPFLSALGPDGYVYDGQTGYVNKYVTATMSNPTSLMYSVPFGANGTADVIRGITFDSSGSMYGISSQGRIHKLSTTDGTYLGLIASGISTAPNGKAERITCDTTTNTLYAMSVGTNNACWKVTMSGTVTLFRTSSETSMFSNLFYDKQTGCLFLSEFFGTLAGAKASTTTTYKIAINPVPGSQGIIQFSFPGTNLSAGSNTLQIYDPSNTVFGIPITVSVSCFLEGTLIKCLSDNMMDDVYIPVEKLTKDTYVKTLSSGYVQIHSIGFTEIYNPSDETEIDNRLFKYKTGDERMPELFQDLYITGNHAALVETFSQEEYARVVKHMGAVYETEKRFRMPACLDPRAEPFVEPGTYKIWHFALQNPDIYTNYGVYANGLLVESSSIRYLTELSKMELV